MQILLHDITNFLELVGRQGGSFVRSIPHDLAIAGERRVVREEAKRLGEALGNQHAIERVFVEGRQARETFGVSPRDG
jgi:hypothetical protein